MGDAVISGMMFPVSSGTEFGVGSDPYGSDVRFGPNYAGRAYPAPQAQVHDIKAELRARKILNRAMEALGFTRVFDGTRAKWVLEDGLDMLTIDEIGAVSINDDFRCIVSVGDSSRYPHGDVIVSKLLSLCTRSRRNIDTLTKDDQEMLDRMIPIDRTRPVLAKIIREEAYVLEKKDA